MRDLEWMDNAVCDDDPAWVTEYGLCQPPPHVLARLQAICNTCPVIKQCATYAIENRLEGQFVGGQFVPFRNSSSGKPDTRGYTDAVRLLKRKADAA